jgi:glucokinase
VENDANLAGLSEALLLKNQYRKVLYLTVSTGIGDGIIVDGKIDAALADSEAGHMLVEHRGEIKTWEEFASGRALKARWGQLAKDIEDPAIWAEFAKLLALGLNELLAVIQPDAVVVGGSVGRYFEKYQRFLAAELEKHPSKMVEIPPILKARRPEEAVIFGCYDYAHQQIR